MYCVNVKDNCPHFDASSVLPYSSWMLDFDNKSPINASNGCTTCGDKSENWVCLGCQQSFCSRYIAGHSQDHYRSTNHALTMSLSDMSVWCNACSDYVRSAEHRYASDSIYHSKFGEYPPNRPLSTTSTALSTQSASLHGLIDQVKALPTCELSADCEDMCAVCQCSLSTNGTDLVSTEALPVPPSLSTDTLSTIEEEPKPETSEQEASAVTNIVPPTTNEGVETLSPSTTSVVTFATESSSGEAAAAVCKPPTTSTSVSTVNRLSCCNQRFHRTCLVTWLIRQNECPTCRTPVLTGWARQPIIPITK